MSKIVKVKVVKPKKARLAKVRRIDMHNIKKSWSEKYLDELAELIFRDI